MSADLPPLGSSERYEIEEIREQLFDAGYDLHFSEFDQGWAAWLQRHGIRGASTPPGVSGETALGVARAALRLYESREDLRSFKPDPEELAKRSDRYFFHTRGTLVIRRGDVASPWLVSWYPNEGDRNYPGFTLSSWDRDFPTEQGIVGVLAWALEQPWICPPEEAESSRNE